MRADDVPAASDASYRSLYAMLVAHHDAFLDPPEQRTPEAISRSESRIAYLVEQDPGGAWVAVDGDVQVGIALASRREEQWFLSLLSVATAYQNAGVGRRLMAAALDYAEGCTSAWLLSSPDVRATRRYHAAGFALHPTYRAHGELDRALLPAALRARRGHPGVRDGDVAHDREFVEEIARSRRGSAYGPDLDAYLLRGALLVLDDPSGRGFAIAGPGGPVVVGASTEAAATKLLWAALGESSDDTVQVGFLSAAQQWAVQVAMAAGLGLGFGGSICVRGEMGPLVPYLPSGAYG